jgi:hypothetical protein
MVKNKKFPNEWNLEDCIEESKKYNTKSEFQKKAAGAYKYADRTNILNDLFENFLDKKRKKYENLENCKIEALKYNNIGEFRNKSRSYYFAAKKLGFLDEICQHMTHKSNTYWMNKESVHQDALQYNARWEWGKKSYAAYSSAIKNGWIDEVCTHMKPPLNKKSDKNKYTKEFCELEAKKYELISVFKNKSSEIYRISKSNNWLSEITAHMIKKDSKSVGYWNDKRLCEDESKKYNTRSEFQDKCSGAYKSAKRNGWIEEFFPKNK